MALPFTQRVVRVLSCAFFVALAGCNKGPSDGYTGERGQVSGTVTVDGTPLQKGCQVIFISKEGGYTAGGVVDEQGKYTLTYNGGPKLPAVAYLVQLTAPVVVETSPTAAVDPTQMGKKMNLSAGAPSASTGPFAPKYGSTTSSTLEFKVEPNKDNVADFKLDKQ